MTKNTMVAAAATIPDSKEVSEIAKSVNEAKEKLQNAKGNIEAKTNEFQKIMASKKEQLLQGKQDLKPAIEKGVDAPTVPTMRRR